MKKVYKRIIIFAIFALLLGIPKTYASASQGDIYINDDEDITIYPENLTGSFYYLTTDTESVLPDFKVTATINGTVYDGTISINKHTYNYIINYPIQKYGTPIIINVTDSLGESESKTFTMDYYIEYNILVNDKDVKQTQITGTTKSDYTYDKYGILKNETVFTVTAKIGNETYQGTVSGYNFTVKYPEQAFDTKVTLFVTDRCEGHTSEETYTIRNHPPKLKVDRIFYYSTYITGKTAPNLDVWAMTSEKNYSGKADSEGNFKMKIPTQKINTELAVGCTSDEGYYNSTDMKVQDSSGYIDIDRDILKNSTALAGTVTGSNEGDYITVKVGNKIYKQELKPAKKQKFKVAVKNLAAGQYITVTLYNKYNQKRDYTKQEVYFALDPRIGMSKKQAAQTSWGSADYISKYNLGGTLYEQWGYDFGDDLEYLWFENGTLKAINSYSY